MRLLVCGDRKWRDRDYIYTILDDLRLFYDVSVVIEGEAAGADRLAAEWAVERGIPVERYPANWALYGKPAGIIRNQQMLETGRPEMVVAFHRSFRESKGTGHMVAIARKAGIQCHIFPHRTTDVEKIHEDGGVVAGRSQERSVPVTQPRSTPRPPNRLGSKSSPEILMAEQLRQAGIPYVMEYKFHPSRRWRCDFALEHNILVEVEGGAYVGGRHVTGSGFEKDAEKYNAAAELDYTVLRYTPRMVNDGSALEQIRRILSKKEEPNAAA